MEFTPVDPFIDNDDFGPDIFIRDEDDNSEPEKVIKTPQIIEKTEEKPQKKRFTVRPSRFFELLDPKIEAESHGFVDLDLSNLRCIVCGSSNHDAKHCRYNNGDRRCFYCGSFTHGIDNCPHSFCKKCLQFGHSHFDCYIDQSIAVQNYAKLVTTNKCWRCEIFMNKAAPAVKKVLSIPHSHLNCPLLTDPLCFICGSPDHGVYDCSASKSQRNQALCAFCGRPGHLYTECNQFRPSKDSPFPEQRYLKTLAAQSHNLLIRTAQKLDKKPQKKDHYAKPATRKSFAEVYQDYQSKPNEMVKEIGRQMRNSKASSRDFPVNSTKESLMSKKKDPIKKFSVSDNKSKATRSKEATLLMENSAKLAATKPKNKKVTPPSTPVAYNDDMYAKSKGKKGSSPQKVPKKVVSKVFANNKVVPPASKKK